MELDSEQVLDLGPGTLEIVSKNQKINESLGGNDITNISFINGIISVIRSPNAR